MSALYEFYLKLAQLESVASQVGPLLAEAVAAIQILTGGNATIMERWAALNDLLKIQKELRAIVAPIFAQEGHIMLAGPDAEVQLKLQIEQFDWDGCVALGTTGHLQYGARGELIGKLLKQVIANPQLLISLIALFG